MLNTDSTPAVCCSMSLCRSCHHQKNSVSVSGMCVAASQPCPFKMLQRMGQEQLLCQEKLIELYKRLAGWAVQMTQMRRELPCKERVVHLRCLRLNSIFSLTVWTILLRIQNPNLIYTINKFLLILTAQDVSYQVTTLKSSENSWCSTCILVTDHRLQHETQTQYTSNWCYTTFLTPSCRGPVLTDCFKGSAKDLLSNLHYRFLFQSLNLHDSPAFHPVPVTTPKVSVIARQKKKALPKYFLLKR